MDVLNMAGVGLAILFLVSSLIVAVQRAQGKASVGSMKSRFSNALAVGEIIFGVLVVIGVCLFLRPYLQQAPSGSGIYHGR